MNKLATVLLCANFITVLFPQPGYIHPDEFFQSSEIVAGDVLGVQHFRVWEFNATFPIRNIVFPYIILSPTLYFLHWINSTGISAFQLSAVKVVMATRLPLSFLTLFGYMATGRLADSFHINRYISTVLYCSSYITWTYFTRTFSNSVEAVLLAVVLLLVLTFSGRGMVAQPSKEVVDTQSVAKDKANLSPTKKSCKNQSSLDEEPLEDEANSSTDESSHSIPPSEIATKDPSSENAATVHKESKKDLRESEEDKLKESKDDISKYMQVKETTVDENDRCEELSDLRAKIAKLISFLLGAVVTAGFFNRPTFLIFAAVPVIYWMCITTKYDQQRKIRGVSLFSVIFCLSLGSGFTFATFVLLDTLYFNPYFIKIVSSSWKACLEDSFSWPTLKFSLELILSSFVITPWNFIKYNSDSRNLAEHGLHPCYTHFLVNLPLLLGPLYIPFVIMCVLSLFRLLRGSDPTPGRNSLAWLTFMALVPILGLSAFPHQEPRFLIPALPLFAVMGGKVVSAMTPGKLSFFTLWTVFNILLTVIYGYMHQAALIPALSIYQQKISSLPPHSTNVHHAIFYKTYSPPRHLLLQHPKNSQVSLHELAGAPVDTLLQRVRDIQSGCQKSGSKCHLHVFLPSTVAPQVLKHFPDDAVKATSICPHLSMEAPPRLRAWWKKRLTFQEFVMDFCLNILKIT